MMLLVIVNKYITWLSFIAYAYLIHARIDALARLYDFLIDQYLFIGDTNYTGKGSKMYI